MWPFIVPAPSIQSASASREVFHLPCNCHCRSIPRILSLGREGNMSGAPHSGQEPTPQQMAAMQQQIAIEAQKRGMTPQQFQNWQRQQFETDARKAGLTVEQYISKLKQQAFENHQRQQQMAQQQAMQQQSGQPQTQGQQGQQVPITPGAPDPKALALAKWLRGQDLKPRVCILNGQRKDIFRGLQHSYFLKHLLIVLFSEASSPRPTISRLYQSLG